VLVVKPSRLNAPKWDELPWEQPSVRILSLFVVLATTFQVVSAKTSLDESRLPVASTSRVG